MAVLNVPCVSSSNFTWNGTNGTTEHSDIRIPLFNRIYDDACDAGFAVVSDKTGKIMIFGHHDTDLVEGEECGWLFTCIGELSHDGRKIKRLPEGHEFTLLVIND